MPSFATLARLLTQDDIQKAAGHGNGTNETPVLSLAADCQAKGYDSICLPLTTDKWRDRWKNMCIMPSTGDAGNEEVIAAEKEAEAWRKSPSFLLDEVTITRLDEAEIVLTMAPEWLQLDSTDDWVRHDSGIALRQEVAYASYLNIPTMILPPPRNRSQVASYARTVNECLKSVPFMQFSVRLPIYDPAIFQSKESPKSQGDCSSSGASSPSSIAASPPRIVIPASSPPRSLRSSKAPEGELNVTWEMWDIIRTICDYNVRLTLTLDLTPPLPANAGVLSRWAAEPVQHIFLPASTFIANVKGYPVLPKATQAFLRQSMIHRPMIVLSGVNAGLHVKGNESSYAQYVRHLEKSSPVVQAARTEGTVEHFAQGYQDYLQNPLQPLMDNLQSITYQTFEQDPVKYHNYEEAIYCALIDWPRSDDERIIICVAGAGRGPLVARSLKAIQRSRRQAFIYAVEKNPSAFVTLQSRKIKEWGSSVQLLFGDMRRLDLPEQVDILVSELLGSFGDNELSPECLDGAVRFLKPGGISIPTSYTAHLAPLSSSKLYNSARESKDLKGVETPYVVMFQNVNILSGDGGGVGRRCGPKIQQCWEFEHPSKDATVDEKGLPLTNSHNVRSAKLCFHIPHAGVMHGLAGYFESVLYGDVGLSIHPHRKGDISKDMLSWFPLFFPFREPLYLPSNSELQVSIWRLTNNRQVWYEWYAESFLPVFNAPVSAEQTEDSSGSEKSFFACASTHVAVPSPVIDAIDAFPAARAETRRASSDSLHTGSGVVKIGQTALHNPGGRSSWIGL
ncbi:PRMT5-domain-containing protein [Phlebopus sp. FC_14]|nr:PRMT5-domain-containing protein [Phlebopus sp. FC_14]